MIDDIKYTFFGILLLAVAFLIVGLLMYLSETENECIANIRRWVNYIVVGITAFGLLSILLYLLHDLGKAFYAKIF